MTDAGAAAPILAALRRMGLLANAALPHCEPLTGGVSSDIWRVDLPEGPICVKRALPRLRVAANWEAPVERSRHEWAWYEVVSARVPGACPRPLARDDATDLFAMAYLAPDLHPLWKTQLLAGHVDRAVAYAVGRLLGRIHAATAGDPVLAAQFATDSCFAALRLDPYLTATAAAHPDVAAAILARRDETAQIRLALVHGDVSPKIFWSVRRDRYCSMPNARGTATRRSMWHSVSITCCSRPARCRTTRSRCLPLLARCSRRTVRRSFGNLPMRSTRASPACCQH